MHGVTPAAVAAAEGPAFPVSPALAGVLPQGLRRGSTVRVAGSVSLVLALLGGASADGAWCALVGLPRISAEAAAAYGVATSRLAVIPSAGPQWARTVGALLDGFDIVVVRPVGQVPAGEAQRLAARARGQGAVLVPFGDAAWPGVEVRLELRDPQWAGIGDGHGRLRSRRVTVAAEGRGRAARPRSEMLWLPAPGGGVDEFGGEVLPLRKVG